MGKILAVIKLNVKNSLRDNLLALEIISEQDCLLQL